ncbi:hypothetical protein SRABI26_04680 [Arthrobacter sp. Bi26]|nr:hypothetical protein SRABI26_04680 [Arthrobacter sp. Bi26]
MLPYSDCCVRCGAVSGTRGLMPGAPLMFLKIRLVA